MTGLHEHLAEILRAGVRVLGLGNPDYGDDGFGVRLAEKLREAGVRDVFTAGVSPERHLDEIARNRCCGVLFLDAVEMGVAPGSAVLLCGDDVKSRYPQLSTHKIALGTLARVLEARGTKVYLLGVQPKSVKMGGPMSGEVQGAIENLFAVIIANHSSMNTATARNESGE